MTLRWTKKPPSVPGWYWWKPGTLNASTAALSPRIELWPEALCVKDADPDDRYGWFAGPIEPPEEKPP